MEQTGRFGILRANAGLIVLLALLSASLLAWQISAQTQASPTASGLKVEIEPVSFFVGQWNCDGEFVASKKPIATHIAVAADLDGSWFVLRWDDNPPNQYHALELWGFDKTAKHFTNFTHDNFGSVRLFDSPGWDGDTRIWTGDALTTPITLSQRFVIERKPNKQFIISWQVRKAESDWTTGDRLACR